VVTSLARYTVRTLSAQGFSPRKVLHQLNRALLDQDDDERFCTVVYGHVLPASSGRSGVRLVLALGGHPQPLVRRREGTVHAVGVPGTALGLLPEIDVTEVVVDLESGDVLLAYTDGVTEARSGDEQFGEDGLAAVLAGVRVSEAVQRAAPRSLAVVTGQAAAEVPLGDIAGADDHEDDERRAGLMADAVADAVLSAVGGFSAERDDVALLVLAAT
jgi:serine phosphatase RsbU (regulator of sigma subunit)